MIRQKIVVKIMVFLVLFLLFVNILYFFYFTSEQSEENLAPFMTRHNDNTAVIRIESKSKHELLSDNNSLFLSTNAQHLDKHFLIKKLGNKYEKKLFTDAITFIESNPQPDLLKTKKHPFKPRKCETRQRANPVVRTIHKIANIFGIVTTATATAVENDTSVKSHVTVQRTTTFKSKSAPFQNTTYVATQKIYQKLSNLSYKYYIEAKPLLFLKQLIEDGKPKFDASPRLWPMMNSWVGPNELVPYSSPYLGSILRTLSSAKIIRAENAKMGSNIKMLLTLEGNQKVIFKPQIYPREYVFEGKVYTGFDRHNGEVAAFQLSLLLGLRRAPMTVGRRVNLREEVMAVATDDLLNTFCIKENNLCFTGICHYCSPLLPVCSEFDYLEGAVIMFLPKPFKPVQHKSPWLRKYEKGQKAQWEVDETYCDQLKELELYKSHSRRRLLDLVDAAIFDFLIQNGDRHDYEVFENYSSMILLIDNGKSFGNPNYDYIDILAPLYQCCIIRKSTWKRLNAFTGNHSLSKALSFLLQESDISPVLTDAHLMAMDRRLFIIFAAVEVCIESRGENEVLVKDACR